MGRHMQFRLKHQHDVCCFAEPSTPLAVHIMASESMIRALRILNDGHHRLNAAVSMKVGSAEWLCFNDALSVRIGLCNTFKRYVSGKFGVVCMMKFIVPPVHSDLRTQIFPSRSCRVDFLKPTLAQDSTVSVLPHAHCQSYMHIVRAAHVFARISDDCSQYPSIVAGTLVDAPSPDECRVVCGGWAVEGGLSSQEQPASMVLVCMDAHSAVRDIYLADSDALPVMLPYEVCSSCILLSSVQMGLLYCRTSA